MIKTQPEMRKMTNLLKRAGKIKTFNYASHQNIPQYASQCHIFSTAWTPFFLQTPHFFCLPTSVLSSICPVGERRVAAATLAESQKVF